MCNERPFGDGVVSSYPIGSMYGIFTYIWLIFMVNVGKYTIHGSYGYLAKLSSFGFHVNFPRCIRCIVSHIIYDMHISGQME